MLAPSPQIIDWWRRAAALGWAGLDRLAAFHDPRQLRNWWLTDMRQLTADYMKSPAFLALMRFNLTMLTQPTMIKAAQTTVALPVR
jgi:hypothetical protein